jgi:Ni2+-binding GTPase involved in maturation of urease and hydrogenase
VTQLALLGGFLGAGKTTTMLAVARLLSARGRNVSVVTNDQAAGLVDTALARRTLPLVDEITGGCFCCRFEDLDSVVRRLVDDAGVDTVIAEAVGSCTDMQATVVRPLRRFYGTALRVAPLTTLVDPERFLALIDDQSDLGYLFRLQLTESDVIVLNKRDLYSADVLDPIERRLRAQFPAAILRCSAATTDGLPELIEAWSAGVTTALDQDLEVDYDRYAAAEAELAWLNHSIALSADAAFAPGEWADRVLRTVATECANADYEIGHAKLSIDCASGLVKMSVTASGGAPTVDLTLDAAVPQATATLNLRVACPPDRLDTLARKAITDADRAVGVRSDILDGAAFQPSYPRPTHRLSALDG